ncbi:GMC oxidoreductase [Schizophyllum fasciatum]
MALLAYVALAGAISSSLAVTITDPAAFAASAFDYIVVGAGSAGMTVAARLSEDPSVKVGVIEAGDTALGEDKIDVPGMFGAGIGTVYDWNYTTEAQQNGVPSRPWPRGRVVGGSSALNFLVWDRPSKADYDVWEKLGNDGWNWDRLLAYIKKAETWTEPSADEEAGLHANPDPSYFGNSGPVHVSFGNHISKATQSWIPALEALGIARNDNPLSGNNIGANQSPSDIRPSNSSRAYSAAAYYYPNEARENLVLLPGALVTGINFDANGGSLTATSVSFVKGGSSYNATVAKEVVLSAGTVNTPQILELSGIGKADVLSAAGVPQLLDLPVGENLQEHTYSSIAFEVANGTDTLDRLRNDPGWQAEQLANWRSGAPSVYDQAVPSLGYVTLPQLVGDTKAAKLLAGVQAYVAAQKDSVYYPIMEAQLDLLADNTVGQMELIAIDGFYAASGAPEAGKEYITYLAANQHAFSRGSIHIASKNASQYPKIQANYFDVDFDLDVQTAGTEKMIEVARSGPFADYVGAQVVPPSDVKDLREFSKTTLATEYHPVGTASMLPRDKGGVVDAQLKVYGTSNLRVADASVVPIHIAAHMQATVVGIGETAADIIKGVA